MRKYLRQIAKARLSVIGIDRINRRMSSEVDGVKLWRRVLDDKNAHNEQARRASGRFKIKPVYIGKKKGA